MLREKSLWEMLEKREVNVKRALLIMKGDEGEAIGAKEAKNAFTYAHGLKGMAANLGLDRIYEKLDMLVELLRSDKLEGAQEIYDAVIKESNEIIRLF